MCERGIKIKENAVLDGAKIAENPGFGGSLGGLGCLWRNLGEDFSENCCPGTPKMCK